MAAVPKSDENEGCGSALASTVEAESWLGKRQETLVTASTVGANMGPESVTIDTEGDWSSVAEVLLTGVKLASASWLLLAITWIAKMNMTS